MRCLSAVSPATYAAPGSTGARRTHPVKKPVQMRSKKVDVAMVLTAVLATVSVGIGHTLRSRTTKFRRKTDSKGNRIMKSKRVQIGLALVALAAVASTSVGVTLALYSNKPAGETNTFVAGTVSVSNVVTGACAATTNNLAPADSASCTLATTYGGTLSGYMALDVFVATQKNTTAGGSSATDLYTPGDANQAQITVSSTTPTVNYVVAGGTPTSLGSSFTCGTGPDNISYVTYDKCYLLQNILVQATAFASGTVTFTTGISVPSSQPNTYQGSSAVVVLAAHAVQSKNNAINCAIGGTSPTAGVVCTPAGSFAWS